MICWKCSQKKKVKEVALGEDGTTAPFSGKATECRMKKYKGARLVWSQEEPANMGCLSYIQRMMPGQAMEFISRKASASRATGYSKVHKAEQEKIVTQSLRFKILKFKIKIQDFRFKIVVP